MEISKPTNYWKLSLLAPVYRFNSWINPGTQLYARTSRILDLSTFSRVSELSDFPVFHDEGGRNASSSLEVQPKRIGSDATGAR